MTGEEQTLPIKPDPPTIGSLGPLFSPEQRSAPHARVMPTGRTVLNAAAVEVMAHIATSAGLTLFDAAISLDIDPVAAIVRVYPVPSEAPASQPWRMTSGRDQAVLYLTAELKQYEQLRPKQPRLCPVGSMKDTAGTPCLAISLAEGNSAAFSHH
ncbi:MAG: hypothetical protein ACM3XM_19060 [Mycobacterium leprae]